MTVNNSKKASKEWLYALICIVVGALGWILPPFLQLTPSGMKIVFLFIASVLGWSLSKRIWPSLMLFCALPFTGIMNVGGLISATYGGANWVFLSVAFIMLAFMEETNVSSYICYWILTRKFAQGRPYAIVFLFMLTAWLLTMFTGNIYVGGLMTWGVFYTFAKKLGYQPYDTFSNIMVFMIGMSATIACNGVPWSPPVLTISATYVELSGQAVDMGGYLLYSVPLCLVGMLIMIVLCKFVFKLDTSRLNSASLDDSFFPEKDRTLTKEMKIALVAMVLFVLMLVLPSFLPKGSAIANLFSSLGMIGLAFILFTVLSLIEVDGKVIFDFPKLAAKGVNWNVIIMVASITGLSICLGNPATGINETMNSLLGGLSGMSKPVFIAVLLFLCVVFTNFFTNALVAMVLLVPAITAGAAYGIGADQAFYMLAVGCSFAIMTPGAGAGATLLFTNREWLETKTIWKYGFPTLIAMSIWVIAYTVIFW